MGSSFYGGGGGSGSGNGESASEVLTQLNLHKNNNDVHASFQEKNLWNDKSWQSVTDKPSSLQGYGIEDAYTKTEVDGLINDIDESAEVINARGEYNSLDERLDAIEANGSSGLQNFVDGSTTGSVRSVESSPEGNDYTIGQYAFAEGYNAIASGNYSYAEGRNATASGYTSHAEGASATASGGFSHAEGNGTEATGSGSHAEGQSTIASGSISHAEGYQTTASGNYSHAEGLGTEASGPTSHTEGAGTTANHKSQHVFGEYNILDTSSEASTARGNYVQIVGNGTGASTRSNARTLDWSGNEVLAGKLTVGSGPVNDMDVATKQYVDNNSGLQNFVDGSTTGSVRGTGTAVEDSNYTIGQYAVAEGYETKASGYTSHAEGAGTTASGSISHAEGVSTTASGSQSHAEGNNTTASGRSSHAEGEGNSLNITVNNTTYTKSGSYGDNSHSEGYKTLAVGVMSHAEGENTLASGSQSHAEGENTTASGVNSHAEGYETTASGNYSHAEGNNTAASYGAHAEGNSTQASGSTSHAEGQSTTASGERSHAEGTGSIASGVSSHAEGISTTASGNFSHAEGNGTKASGYYSHAEGVSTTAYGDSSHAEGQTTTASGDNSHAEGRNTIASGSQSHAGGRYTVASGVGAYVEGNSYYSSSGGTDKQQITLTGDKNATIYTYDTLPNIIKVNNQYFFDGVFVKVVEIDTTNTTITFDSTLDSSKNLASKTVDIYIPSISSGDNSHAEGYQTKASGYSSHAEGSGTTASGQQSHAEGAGTTASGLMSHAEGVGTTASGYSSHAEGNATEASGSQSHAEGNNTTASVAQSHAEGDSTEASNHASHAEGYNTKASNHASHAEGDSTTASGTISHAEGSGTTASGLISHAEGAGTTASGQQSHAEGAGTTASGAQSHAEGGSTTASGSGSHAEGAYTVASGEGSHVEGGYTSSYNGNITLTGAGNVLIYTYTTLPSFIKKDNLYFFNNKLIKIINIDTDSKTITLDKTLNTTALNSADVSIKIPTLASGFNSHAEGLRTTASGDYSHAEGISTTASGVDSHAEGTTTKASGNSSHAEGAYTTASGDCSHAEGYNTQASKQEAHAEGKETEASGDYSHAEGSYTKASSYSSHAEGNYTIASGTSSHAEGQNTTASGLQSHAEGIYTTASGYNSHAEGSGTTASEAQSHAEGLSTTASGLRSHAEGYSTIASGANSHAQGSATTASGANSHAEGYQIKASGDYSHAEGSYTTASGTNSHAEGNYTTANHASQHVFGEYNVLDTSSEASTARGNFVEIVGNGTSSTRSNARTLDWSGNEVLAGKLTVGSGPVNDMDVATKQYVDNNSGLQNLVDGSAAGSVRSVGSAVEDSNYTIGLYAVAEGIYTKAPGQDSHAEGQSTKASGQASHAQGFNSKASGSQSHAEGSSTTASGFASHAEGSNTTATHKSQHVFGEYNILDSSTITADYRGNYVEIVGNGTYASRSNARTLDWNGNEVLAGKLTVGSGPVNNMDVTTKQYVDNLIDSNISSAYKAAGSIAFSSLPSLTVSNLGKVYNITNNFTTNSDFVEGAGKEYPGGTNVAIVEVSENTYKYDVLAGFVDLSGYATSNDFSEVTDARGTYNSLDERLDAIEANSGSGLQNLVDGSTGGSVRGVGSAVEDSSYTIGLCAVAEGYQTKASGNYSHAEGGNTTASGYNSHAEGYGTIASNSQSHAEGNYTTASGIISHAEGYHTKASGSNSHAEGNGTTANHKSQHVFGEFNILDSSSEDAASRGNFVEIVGNGTSSTRSNARTLDWNGNEVLAGKLTVGSGPVNDMDVATKQYVDNNSGLQNFVDGSATGSVRGVGSTAESSNYTIGSYAVAEGKSTKASGYSSHAEGESTKASGGNSHAEGYNTTASGYYSHVEGYNTTASTNNSHAEGYYTTASGDSSHTEGSFTTASSNHSHAEGGNTTASGPQSHAEGSATTASGAQSHAEGLYTTANHKSQHVFGEYNILDSSTAASTNRGNYVEIVGNGTYESPSNARTLDWDGNEVLAGKLTVGSGPVNDMDVATKQYVDNNSGGASDWDDVQNKPTTISGYGITDAYTKTEVNNLVNTESIIYYDGFHADNSQVAQIPTAGPYTVMSPVFSNVNITKFKINVETAGTFTIGTIPKSKYPGEQFDVTDANIHEVITFTETGVQTINLTTPMYVGIDEHVFFELPTDTAKFYYGSNSVDKGFGNGNTFITTSSIGISLYGEKVDLQQFPMNNPYKGKKLSILGDSISTFAGYIPEGNATFYPNGTVQNVNDTWWKKVINGLDMELCVNNSWSGSRVTGVSESLSAGCNTRCQNLGEDPDVIIVWMGINDFDWEVPLGEYDGTTAVGTDTTKFRNAYGIMLNKILTAYPKAEVFVCTLLQDEVNQTSTGFPEINDAGIPLKEFNDAIVELAANFGVKVLDNNTCGIRYHNLVSYTGDYLHPTHLGHDLLANNMIRQMLAGGTLYAPHLVSSSLNERIEGIENELEPLTDIIKSQSVVYCNGYNANNVSNAAMSTSPFSISKTMDQDIKITSIKLIVVTAGTLSLGTVDKTYLVANADFDRSNVTIHKVLNITETGEQTITLPVPIDLPTTKALTIGNTTDTIVFKYGQNGNDKGFYYISSGKLIASGSSLGFDIYGETVTKSIAELVDARGSYNSLDERLDAMGSGLLHFVDGSATGSVRGVGSAAEGSSYTMGQNAVAEGNGTKASGLNSHAEGAMTVASAYLAHAEGRYTTASGQGSHVEGNNTIANHVYQHVFGEYNVADTSSANSDSRGDYVEIVGNGTSTSARSNARTLDWNGNEVLAGKLTVGSGPVNDMDVATKQYVDNNSGLQNFVDGSATGSVRGTGTAVEDSNYTMGTYAVAEGYQTKASGIHAHAEGDYTTASGDKSHAEGSGTTASGDNSHAEGYQTTASISSSHAEGYSTTASGNSSHAEGTYTTASGINSHAEGRYTTANHRSQHVFGEYNILDSSTATATNKGNYIEIVGNGTGTSARSNARTLDWNGNETLAGKLTVGSGPVNDMDVATKQYVDNSGLQNFVDGSAIGSVRGVGSTVESSSYMMGQYTVAEGYATKASGAYSHAENYGTTASGSGSHAEGNTTTASGDYSHAEGGGSTASGYNSHAEGSYTTASGLYSHAEGQRTTASGDYSHAEGRYTTSNHKSQHVFGEYNILDTSTAAASSRGNYVEIVGNGTGTSDSSRSNARTLDWSGNETLAGKLTVGSGPVNNMDVATKQYVDNILGNFANIEQVTAIGNHSVGDLIIVEGKLRKVTSAITSGDTIDDNNSAVTTIAAELLAILNA